MNKLIQLGFATLELSQFLMSETNFDKLQLCFNGENLQLHYIDCDSFVLSIRPQIIIIDLKSLQHLFDSGNLNENHELFSNKNKKLLLSIKMKPIKKLGIRCFEE